MDALITKGADARAPRASLRLLLQVGDCRVDSGPSLFRLEAEVGATTYVERYLIRDSAKVRMGTIAAIDLGGTAEGGRAQQFGGGGVAGKELFQRG
jgi:hypothetical protein